MKNNGKKILAVVLLLLVLVLGGVSVFVATRISTQKPVAPTAPTSKPRASIGANWCAVCSAESQCLEGLSCLGGICNSTDPALKHDCWFGATACSISFDIPKPPCVARPACLDEKPACMLPTPEGGYCPYLSCVKDIYKDDAANTAGSYNLKEKLPAGSVVYPGQVLVFSAGYTNGADIGSVKSAIMTDTLDSNFEFMDSDSGCAFASSKLTCQIGEIVAKGSSQVSFRVKVKPTAPTGLLNNKMSLASVFDQSGSNIDTSTFCATKVDVQPQPVVKLSCTKKLAMNEAGTSEITQVGKSTKFLYSMTVQNSGNAPAPEVFLTDALPTGVTFVSSSTGCAVDSTNKVVCKTNLDPGKTKVLSFIATTSDAVKDGDKIKNTAMCALTADTTGGSECTNDIVVALPFIKASKEAYKDNSNNTAGSYQLTEAINTVSKNQTFVYSIKVENTGTATASGVVVNDPLTGEGQSNLTFVDKMSNCTWTEASRLVKCTLDVQPGKSGKVSFRVKVSDSVANGDMIKNIGHVILGEQDLTVTKDLTVSSIVGCNNTCTTDAECSGGLKCDSASHMCRAGACVLQESCTCPATITEAPTASPTATTTVAPTATTTAAPTATGTTAPTATATTTAAPTATATLAAGQTAAPTATGTTAPTATAKPQTLPDTGIFDIPGMAVFGGGLMLAIVGLLLAL